MTFSCWYFWVDQFSMQFSSRYAQSRKLTIFNWKWKKRQRRRGGVRFPGWKGGLLKSGFSFGNFSERCQDLFLARQQLKFRRLPAKPQGNCWPRKRLPATQTFLSAGLFTCGHRWQFWLRQSYSVPVENLPATITGNLTWAVFTR